MSNGPLALAITQPAHGASFGGAAPMLKGAVTGGDADGLYFKWYSSLYAAPAADLPAHVEMNKADHSAVALNWNAALAEFGSHAIVLAAADQDGADLASIKAVKRSALAGGAPLTPPLPGAPAPCVVHRLVAQITQPAADGQNLSKANATIKFRAPDRWGKPDANNPAVWVADPDYQKGNGITFALRLAPAGAADPAHTADLALTLTSLPFEYDGGSKQLWFRWSGALPANLGLGNYQLILSVSAAGGAPVTATRSVVLVA